MKQIIKLILITLVSLLATSCTATRSVITTSHKSDLRSYEKQIDTIVRTVVDSAVIRALLECDSAGRIRVADLKIRNSVLQNQLFTLENNLLRISTRTQQTDRIREIIKIDTLKEYVEVPVPYPEVTEVNRLYWWQRWLIWIGVAYVVRLIIKLIASRGKLTFKQLLKII